MSQVLIGIDSGGTRTNVEVRHADVTYQYELSETLSGSLSPRFYAETIQSILLPAASYLIDNFPNEPVAIFISAAGFTPAYRDDFLDAIRTARRDYFPGGVESIGIANDAVSLLLGLEADVVVIAGTGSNVLVRDGSGHIFQIGGHEWVVADYGSGFWIGLRAIRQAYKDYEGDEKSVLLQRLGQVYGIRGGDERRLIAKFRDLAIADSNMKPEVARFASYVCAAAERGDRASQDIVKAEAEELADVLAGALRRRRGRVEAATTVDPGVTTIVECGSLLGNGFYSRVFRTQVELRIQTGTDASSIAWNHTATGTGAAVNLAKLMSNNELDISEIASEFRPLIVRFEQ